jgi:predicted RNase H-like nuclease (RuvC/YqgF family)
MYPLVKDAFHKLNENNGNNGNKGQIEALTSKNHKLEEVIKELTLKINKQEEENKLLVSEIINLKKTIDTLNSDNLIVMEKLTKETEKNSVIEEMLKTNNDLIDRLKSEILDLTKQKSKMYEECTGMLSEITEKDTEIRNIYMFFYRKIDLLGNEIYMKNIEIQELQIHNNQLRIELSQQENDDALSQQENDDARSFISLQEQPIDEQFSNRAYHVQLERPNSPPFQHVSIPQTSSLQRPNSPVSIPRTSSLQRPNSPVGVPRTSSLQRTVSPEHVHIEFPQRPEPAIPYSSIITSHHV